MKKQLSLGLKVIVSLGLFTIIYLKIDKEQFLNSIKMLDARFIPIILLLLILNYVVSSIRWKYLLIHEGTEHVTVKYLTYLYFIGSFFNNFMPTSIGGDVYKVYKLGKKVGDTTNSFAATFMERFSGVFVLALISIFGLYSIIGWLVAPALIAFVAAFFVGLWMLNIVSKKFTKLRKIYDALMVYNGKWKVVFISLLTSLVVQLIAIFTQYFIFTALGINLPLFYSLTVFPLITLASFFIPSLNGLGVQDTLYMRMFAVAGVASGVSLSASIIYHLSRLSVSLIGGLLYAMGKDE